jgi:hypothetical protein
MSSRVFYIKNGTERNWKWINSYRIKLYVHVKRSFSVERFNGLEHWTVHERFMNCFTTVLELFWNSKTDYSSFLKHKWQSFYSICFCLDDCQWSRLLNANRCLVNLRWPLLFFYIKNRKERNRTERNGTEWNGTERNRTEQNRTERKKHIWPWSEYLLNIFPLKQWFRF